MDKNQLGIQYMQEGKWEEAAQIFMEAIEENPSDPTSYINFGNVLSAVGETEKALKFYEKAIGMDPNAATAYYSAGNLYYELQNFKEAKNMFETAMKKGLESGDNYFMLGLTLVALEQGKLALPYLQRSTELNETDSEAFFQYGLCLAHENFIDESIVQLENIKEALLRAIEDKERGLGEKNIQLTDEALTHFATASNGDVRSSLNALELAVLSTEPNSEKIIHIDLAAAEECMQRKSLTHDKDGDAHYDVLSAFQKSIRGSDTNAALHYLGRLIEAGDLQSISRRLLVIAYEDIGLASPQAGARTLAAIEAAERVGFPEARIPLANAVIELCLSPKSNSAIMAIDSALADIRNGMSGEVPDHLKDAHYKGAKELGRGIDYKYPHDYESGWVKQQYLPNKIKNKSYYSPKKTGKFEQALASIYANIQK